MYDVDSAPMQSNMLVKSQSTFSPAPQKATSALSRRIFLKPVPMQCASVDQAEEMEKLAPWTLKAVARVTLTVDPMKCVTWKGPTLFSQCLPPALTASAIYMMSGIELTPLSEDGSEAGVLLVVQRGRQR